MDKYTKKINKYKKMINIKDNDIEGIHEYRDAILMKFIKDIAFNKLSENDIILISKKIYKKIIDNEINKKLWYV